MENLSPRWQKFAKNFGWYLATMVVLVIFFTFLRHAFVLVILWGVGLGWGGVLAYQFSQLLLGGEESIVDEEQLRSYMEQALAYKAKIDQAIRSSASKTDHIHQDQLARQIDTWTEAITNLVQRLSSLRQDEVIRQDLKQVPKAIADLETRLAEETDPALQAQLSRTLANRQKQLASLKALQNTMVRAEVQIESTLSMLGTIYSQILTGQSTSDVADYSRLSTEVDEEVRLLQDHLEALREVKLGSES
jgi:hypothetical protein